MIEKVVYPVLAAIITAILFWVFGYLKTVNVILPSNAVVSFNLDECPTGWEEYEQAYGRFIRGQDKSENPIDPDGKRAIGDQQKFSMVAHNHAITLANDGNPNGGGDTDGNPNYLKDRNRGRNTLIKSNLAGNGSEVRPVNVVLLYCIKN